jgi:predicted RNA-binding protein YlxR (DUF448 family)
MATATHIPIRRCVACREAHPKRQLIRFVGSALDIRIDLTQRASGRGTSLCVVCAANALVGGDPLRLRGFRRAFRQHADFVITLLRPLEATLVVAARFALDAPTAAHNPTVSPPQVTAGDASRPNGGMHG